MGKTPLLTRIAKERALERLRGKRRRRPTTPPRLTDATELNVTDGAERWRTTWGTWRADNADTPDLVRAVKAELEHHGRWAEGDWLVTVA